MRMISCYYFTYELRQHSPGSLRLEDRIARGKEQKSGKPFSNTTRNTCCGPYCCRYQLPLLHLASILVFLLLDIFSPSRGYCNVPRITYSSRNLSDRNHGAASAPVLSHSLVNALFLNPPLSHLDLTTQRCNETRETHVIISNESVDTT